MAQLIGGLAASHIPSIGNAIAKGLHQDPYWKPFFDGFPPIHRWLDGVKPDVAVVFYNDHGLNFFLDKMPTFAIGAAPEYRNADEGYLIGRIFINREKCYFVEGKQQTSMRPMQFGKAEIDSEALVRILESAIYYALNFDLLLPSYDDNKRVTVDQFNTKLDNSKFVTGKRLGYDFDVDDI